MAHPGNQQETTLSFFLQRRRDMSAVAFAEHCQAAYSAFGDHAVTEGGAAGYAISVVQDKTHTICARLAHGFGGAAVDAFVEIRWPDLKTYQAAIGSAAGLAWIEALRETERRFVELSESRVVVASRSTPAAGTVIALPVEG